MILTNAFSLQMLDLSKSHDICIQPISLDEVKKFDDIQSAIGHVDTAAVLSNMLGKEISANRINVKLSSGNQIVVAQIVGGRLPEGSTKLPSGFEMTFVLVTVK